MLEKLNKNQIIPSAATSSGSCQAQSNFRIKGMPTLIAAEQGRSTIKEEVPQEEGNHHSAERDETDNGEQPIRISSSPIDIPRSALNRISSPNYALPNFHRMYNSEPSAVHKGRRAPPTNKRNEDSFHGKISFFKHPQQALLDEQNSNSEDDLQFVMELDL